LTLPGRAQESPRTLLAITALALVVRLALLPFATTDGGDAISRTWIAWRWLSDPEFITHGVWGPLHTYLLGAVLAVFPDPIHAPLVLHVAFGVAAVWLIYLFTKEVFSSTRAALLVAAIYALYPVAIRDSISVRSESIFVIFLLAAMLLVAIARSERGRANHAAGAGLALTLAAMLRYEAWMLIPLLGVLLWQKPRLMILFGVVAMIHPVIWMAGNWAATGDPLYSVTWAADWNLEAMGRVDLSVRELLLRGARYPITTLRGMNMLVGLLAVAGALIALIRREPAGWGACWSPA
jgi:4-amino-4-deoxy-L-arabinose transferase-like glycosyltransferase